MADVTLADYILYYLFTYFIFSVPDKYLIILLTCSFKLLWVFMFGHQVVHVYIFKSLGIEIYSFWFGYLPMFYFTFDVVVVNTFQIKKIP